MAITPSIPFGMPDDTELFGSVSVVLPNGSTRHIGTLYRVPYICRAYYYVRMEGYVPPVAAWLRHAPDTYRGVRRLGTYVDMMNNAKRLFGANVIIESDYVGLDDLTVMLQRDVLAQIAA